MRPCGQRFGPGLFAAAMLRRGAWSLRGSIGRPSPGGCWLPGCGGGRARAGRDGTACRGGAGRLRGAGEAWPVGPDPVRPGRAREAKADEARRSRPSRSSVIRFVAGWRSSGPSPEHRVSEADSSSCAVAVILAACAPILRRWSVKSAVSRDFPKTWPFPAAFADWSSLAGGITRRLRGHIRTERGGLVQDRRQGGVSAPRSRHGCEEEKREVLGEKREYLTIKILHNDMTVNVPPRMPRPLVCGR
jgi:hypothetical protein